MSVTRPSGRSCVDWLSGEYASGTDAEQVAARLVDEVGLAPDEIDVIDPQDPMIGRAPDGDNGCVGRRLLGRHLGYMSAGALAGLLASLVPLHDGQPVLLYHVVMIAGAVLLGAAVGLVLGGLRVGASSDDGVMARARHAQQLQHWMVVARVVDAKHHARVAGILSGRQPG